MRPLKLFDPRYIVDCFGLQLTICDVKEPLSRPRNDAWSLRDRKKYSLSRPRNDAWSLRDRNDEQKGKPDCDAFSKTCLFNPDNPPKPACR